MSTEPKKSKKKLFLVIPIIAVLAGSMAAWYNFQPEEPVSAYVIDKKMVWDKIGEGYDIVCDTDSQIQYCLINSTGKNLIGKAANKISVEYSDFQPCVNVYLHTENATTDRFGITDDKSPSCVYAIVLNSNEGWSYKTLEPSEQNPTRMYEVSKPVNFILDSQ